jgi:hypothetical protein
VNFRLNVCESLRPSAEKGEEMPLEDLQTAHLAACYANEPRSAAARGLAEARFHHNLFGTLAIWPLNLNLNWAPVLTFEERQAVLPLFEDAGSGPPPASPPPGGGAGAAPGASADED